MRLSYSEDLETMNNHESGSVGTLAHSVWVAGSCKEQLWKGEGYLQTTERFRQQGPQAVNSGRAVTLT